MADEMETGDWPGYRRLIVSQLKSFENEVSSLRKDLRDMREGEIQEMKVEIALLKLKSGVWASIVGALSSIIVTGGAILLRMVH